MVAPTDRSILTTPLALNLSAEILGISEVQVASLARSGWIPKKPDGYLITDLVQGYVRSRLEAGQKEQKEQAAELGKLKVEEKRMELEVARGKLVDFADVVAAEDEHIGALFSDLEGVPAAYTRDLKERRRLMGLLDAARNAWAARLRARAARVAA